MKHVCYHLNQTENFKMRHIIDRYACLVAKEHVQWDFLFAFERYF